MSRMVNVHEAKTHLSKLLTRVEQGEEVVIARSGKPVARLIRISPARAPRIPGTGKAGIISMAADFNAPLPEEILREFGA